MTGSHTLEQLPNLVSCSRLLLAAGFVAAEGQGARLGLIGAAAATDFLDGWLARRVHATSRWGALLDPLADRLFVLTVVATLLVGDALGPAECLVLLSRDIATALGFVVARVVPRLRDVEFKARPLGKLVTVLQLITLAGVLAYPAAVPSLLAAVAVTSALSIVDYALALWRARRAR